jgi:hypothetical protein
MLTRIPCYALLDRQMEIGSRDSVLRARTGGDDTDCRFSFSFLLLRNVMYVVSC